MVSFHDIEVRIAGTKGISLVDVLNYPSFTVWFTGCNFRCPWCQNWPIVVGKVVRNVKVADIINEVEAESKFIDFVHVTGGEPTLQPKALEALYTIVKRELKIKTSLNTNGFNFEIVKELILKGLIDHIAIDVKAPFSKPDMYEKVTGVNFGKKLVERIKRTVSFSITKLNFVELRTTFVPLLNNDDIFLISNELKELGCDNNCHYVIQQFIPNENAPVDAYRHGEIISAEELVSLAKEIRTQVGIKNIYVRSIEEGLTIVK